MHSKAYSGRNVNQIDLGKLLNGRDGQRVWACADIGKYEVQLVLNWGQSDFERPWKIGNPQDIGVTVELLKRLSQERELILALEPSGTYGDILRQQCSDGGIVVHRVHPKVSHDYAEVFDGVPSQHDGKDAAVVAELARLGKSAPWPWIREPEELQQIAYWVEELDIQRRLEQMWLGRLEAIMARYWPELPRQMRLSRKTLLKAVAHYGGPAALAQDEKAAEHLKGWGGNRLSDAAVKQIIEGCVIRGAWGSSRWTRSGCVTTPSRRWRSKCFARKQRLSCRLGPRITRRSEPWAPRSAWPRLACCSRSWAIHTTTTAPQPTSRRWV